VVSIGVVGVHQFANCQSCQSTTSAVRVLVWFFWIAMFVVLFLWAFFWVQHSDVSLEQPYQIPSLIGMISSYIILGLLWWVVQGDSLGFLVYAGSFAGFQKSIQPALVSIALALAVSFYFALQDSG
jgi:hypothetical protein